MSPRETEGSLKSFALSGLAGRIFVPPLVALLLLFVYVVVEAIGYRGLARAEAQTAAEAAALGHAARTLQLIDEGQNPNQLQHVRADFLDVGEYELRPLEAAILARHAELVRLLLRVGAARFDTSRASCFARARLPEVLPDLGARVTDSAQPIDIAAAFRMCAAD
jgi:putative Flp pilus-assembly TadE/G-like protein